MNLILFMVPMAPLTMALAVAVAGHRWPRMAGLLAVAGPAASLGALVLIGGRNVVVEMEWLRTGPIDLTVGLTCEGLARVTAWIVAAVALAVNWYAVGFMGHRRGHVMFHALMSFFTGSMLVLVLANSTVLMFAAWEAVGVASFCLIGFWHHEEKARRAARRAFLMTRFGDLALLLGLLMAAHQVGSTRIDGLLASVSAGSIPKETLIWIAMLLLGGVVGKSAQWPLSIWLPDAMAGPAPVSALIHSATMVAAGAFLLLQFYMVFEAAPGALIVLMVVGGMTALLSALAATAQKDAKRVLAWSTSSQLGEMTFAVGLAGPLAASFHLITHATFKSALFLADGAVERATGTRRLDRLGGMAKRMPFTAAIFAVAALALAGIPPFAGFWSADKILGEAVGRSGWLGGFFILLFLLAGIYIGRVGTSIFLKWPRAPFPAAQDPEFPLRAGMVLLAIGAAGVGWALSHSMANLLPFHESAPLPILWKSIAVLAALTGIWFGFWRVRRHGPVPALGLDGRLIEAPLNAVAVVPARLCHTMGIAVKNLERLLDRWTQKAAHGIAQLALWMVENLESLLDRWTQKTTHGIAQLAFWNSRTEEGLDAGSRRVAQAALAAGRAAERTEGRGFQNAVDAMAGQSALAGTVLRRLATGKVYLYTLGLFAWVLLVCFLSLLWTVGN